MDFDDLDHERFMREALDEARLALQHDERPNHIKHYPGGVLEAESAALWARANPHELKMLQDGKR